MNEIALGHAELHPGSPEMGIEELLMQLEASEAARALLEEEFQKIGDYVGELEGAVMEDNVATSERQNQAHIVAEELRQLVLTDKLTGLGNAHAFATATERLESPEGATEAICYFDVNNLTLANNTGGGHAQGDMVLKRAGDSLKATADWCNTHCTPVAANDQPKGNRGKLISVERSGFRQGGDELAWIVNDVEVSYIIEDRDGTQAQITRPLTEVFLERASAEFGTVLFCGRDTSKTSEDVILGVSSLVGGYAKGGEPGAVDRADAASAEAKRVNREPVLRRFLRDHEQPAADSLGRTIQIKRDQHTGGGIVAIDGVEMPFDKIVEDKSGTELPLAA